MRATRYALIPTHNRPEELRRLVRQLDGQTDYIFVIDNASEPRVVDSELDELCQLGTTVMVFRDEEQPPNLYRLWNVGFNAILENQSMIFGTKVPWDIAVLNDDSDLPHEWYDYVAARLGNRTTAPAVACTDPYGILRNPLIKTQSGDGNINVRMCPWAFVVRGELDLRADQRFGWWWGDTDFDWQACRAGGVLLLPDYTTKNTLANSTTHGALAEQAGRDAQSFIDKWGFKPW